MAIPSFLFYKGIAFFIPFVNFFYTLYFTPPQGSSYLLRAHGMGGARAFTFFFSKNHRLDCETGNASGKKEKGGLGEMNFCSPAPSGVGSVSAILHQQNIKIEKFSFP